MSMRKRYRLLRTVMMSVGNSLPVFIGFLWLAAISQVSVAKDFCQFESLNATCPLGQVIVLEEAQYGRMKTGRCVSRDYGYMGCSMSVLNLLDRSCSGRRSCEYGVPRLRDLVQPCPKDLVAYLEVTYRCVKVTNLSNVQCNSSLVLLSSNSTVYIADIHGPDDRGRLFTPCPLHVQVRPRQSINITLHSFGHYLDEDDAADVAGGAQRFCPAHLIIAEGQRRHSSPLCPSRQRERNIYLSHRSSVSLYFNQQPRKIVSAANRWTFILKIEAVGCADVALPNGAWMERYGDRMTVRCNFSRETWYLTCIDNRWTGLVNNCTEGVAIPGKEEKRSTEEGKIPFGMVVAVSVGIVLGFIAGFAMLLFVFLNRQSRNYCTGELKMDPLCAGVEHQTEETALCSNNIDNNAIYPRRIFLECRYSSGMMTCSRGHDAPLPLKDSSHIPLPPPVTAVCPSCSPIAPKRTPISPYTSKTDSVQNLVVTRPIQNHCNVDGLDCEEWEEQALEEWPRPRKRSRHSSVTMIRPETVACGISEQEMTTSSHCKPDLVLSQFTRCPYSYVTDGVIDRTETLRDTEARIPESSILKNGQSRSESSL